MGSEGIRQIFVKKLNRTISDKIRDQTHEHDKSEGWVGCAESAL